MRHRTVSDLVGTQVLVQLPPGAAVREAVRLMAERHIGAVLVTESGRLVGIFTERDMVNRVAAEGCNLDATTLDSVMTKNPRTVEADSPALSALRLMQLGHFRHLPVTRKGRLSGIVSLRDFAGNELAEVEREGDLGRAFAEGGRESG